MITGNIPRIFVKNLFYMHITNTNYSFCSDRFLVKITVFRTFITRDTIDNSREKYKQKNQTTFKKELPKYKFVFQISYG